MMNMLDDIFGGVLKDLDDMIKEVSPDLEEKEVPEGYVKGTDLTYEMIENLSEGYND